ncbi:hypothetical protein MFLAVUS_003543 [Mucor flavus]|uniref:ATP synthase F0 subunit 8 n=1 Tax=Mucor flavus TaxID=439312 RepID=A0ABP9YTD9_9FUNG
MSSSVQDSSKKMKQMSVLGFVSVAAIIHSQLFWVYSIIYIAYHKITPAEESQTLRWKPKKDIPSKKKRHHRKKSLTSKKSVVIPTIIPTKGTVVINLGTTNTLTQSQRAPPLQSFHTIPSTAKQAPVMIKSQRKLLLRSSSTGQLNMSSLPALIEVDTRSSEESSVCSSTNEEHVSKRDRAIDLLRSTFQRSHSSNSILRKSNSFSSSFSSDEGIVVVEEKRRKRDAILGIRRKLSVKFIAHSNILAEEDTKKPTKPKLFRNLPSWKKGKTN